MPAPVASLSSLAPLRDRAEALASRAHVPFSGQPTAAVLLLDDGQWIPGVRVESASYSLTIPALLNGYTTAVTWGRAADVVAFALSRPFRREERLYVEELPYGSYKAHADDVWLKGSRLDDGTISPAAEPLSPFLSGPISEPTRGVRDARRVATHAYVPASDFHVGAVLELSDGRLVPGVNVEHTDWARILCAERNALGTVCSYDAPPAQRLFLSCAEDPEGTPCGACRQLIMEQFPDVGLWMDRHDDAPEHVPIASLLPGSFRGQALLDES
ncbi:MAG: cytidine deaminase [Salinibacter sp.]